MTRPQQSGEFSADNSGEFPSAIDKLHDTDARHAGRNSFCTQIGNDDFTWFGTRASKSRLNFLDLLQAGYTDYLVNDAALDNMGARSLAGAVVSRLAAASETCFADDSAWQAHLQCLGISDMQVTPDPTSIATEGAQRGAAMAHGFLPNADLVRCRGQPC